MMPTTLVYVSFLFALCSIGIDYRDGLGGLKPNLEKAFQWFSRAANHGEPSGQNNLGLLLMNGLGCRKVKNLNWQSFSGRKVGIFGNLVLTICKQQILVF